jgi:hypothetical protein
LVALKSVLYFSDKLQIWEPKKGSAIKNNLSNTPYLKTMSSIASSSRRDKTTPKQHRCEICGKGFDSLDTLDSHKRLDHSESGKSQSPAGVG